MLEVNDKFACICLRSWGGGWSDKQGPEFSIELAPSVWASNRLPFPLTDADKKDMGHWAAHDVQSADIYLFSKHPATEPEVQDLELTALDRRVMRLYVGLLFVTPGIALRSARLIDGVRIQNGIRLFKDGHPYPLTYQAAGTPNAWGIGVPHLHHAARVARGLLATHATGEFHRMGRVSASMREALGARELATRLHHSVRALEGLILPKSDRGTNATFAERVKFFCGAQHLDLLRALYIMRGKIEHLHGPVVAVQSVRSDVTDATDAMVHFAFAAFVAENLARACVTRVYETPKLWPHFSTDAGLEAFWSKPKRAEWGPEIDLRRIIHSYEKETARAQLADSYRQERVGDNADAIDQQWIDRGE